MTDCDSRIAVFLDLFIYPGASIFCATAFILQDNPDHVFALVFINFLSNSSYDFFFSDWDRLCYHLRVGGYLET